MGLADSLFWQLVCSPGVVVAMCMQFACPELSRPSPIDVGRCSFFSSHVFVISFFFLNFHRGRRELPDLNCIHLPIRLCSLARWAQVNERYREYMAGEIK